MLHLSDTLSLGYHMPHLSRHATPRVLLWPCCTSADMLYLEYSYGHTSTLGYHMLHLSGHELEGGERAHALEQRRVARHSHPLRDARHAAGQVLGQVLVGVGVRVGVRVSSTTSLGPLLRPSPLYATPFTWSLSQQDSVRKAVALSRRPTARLVGVIEHDA